PRRDDGPQGPRLEVLAVQVSFLLQRPQVVIDAVGGLDAEVAPDLPQRGRIAALGDRAGYEVEDLALPIGQRIPVVFVSHQRQMAHGGCLLEGVTEQTYGTEQMSRVKFTVKSRESVRRGRVARMTTVRPPGHRPCQNGRNRQIATGRHWCGSLDLAKLRIKT